MKQIIIGTVFAVLAILLIVQGCSSPRGGAVEIAEGASVKEIDTGSDATSEGTKLEDQSRVGSITYNSSDIRLTVGIAMAALGLFCVALMMDGPKSERARLTLLVIGLALIASSVGYFFMTL